MDLRRFITFKTVVEEGSFLRAAQKLCCTQSTVTFHIQQLEQELAIPLFEKIGRRMCLTAAGKKVLPGDSEARMHQGLPARPWRACAHALRWNIPMRGKAREPCCKTRAHGGEDDFEAGDYSRKRRGFQTTGPRAALPMRKAPRAPGDQYLK